MSEREHILVIKLGALGDFIQALGPMAAIRKHHPKAEITLLTTKPYEQFGKDCGYFDEIWTDKRPGWLDVFGWQVLRRQLHSKPFRRVYDLQNNDRTALYFKLMMSKNRCEWVGAAKGASHSNQSPERTAGHAFDGHKQTLALAGINQVEIDKLDWMQADISCFPLKRPFVLIVPGSAPNRPEKRWPAQQFGRLCSVLTSWGYQPVLLGTNTERKIAETIVNICPEALDLCEQTNLSQIASLARSASAAIGNDTGPMHLIAATGCPTMAIFSQHSDPIRHRPLGKDVKVVQSNDLNALDTETLLEKLKPRHDPEEKLATLH